MGKNSKLIKLKGQAIVYIDWANVHGWTSSLKREVSPKRLYKYLKSYKEIKEVRFYFGKDKHPKSRVFLQQIKKIGYKVVTKPVKYIVIGSIKGQKIYKRKCDFDIETCIDVHKAIQEGVKSFIFFSGDGDFEPLHQLLVSLDKQVIVIYASGHVGRELLKIQKKIFLFNIKHLLKANLV